MLFILVVGAVVFGVRWGDFVVVGALVVVWVLVGMVVGMLSGIFFWILE